MFYKRFKPGHVLYVSRRTYLRKVAVPEFEGITGEKTFVLETIDSNALLQEFLPHLLSAERFHAYAMANSRGSVNPYLNWGELAAYEFDLPPLHEQKRIADLLWAIESHLRSLTRLLDSQAASGRAAFSRLLQGVAAEARHLGDVGQFTRGRRFTKADYTSEGLGCVHYAQIHTDFGISASTPLTRVPEAMRASLRLAHAGDLIVAGTSEDVKGVGKAVAWLGDDVAVHDDCFVYSHSLDPLFASYLFASAEFDQQKRSYVSESKVVRLSAASLEKLEFLIPETAGQQSIAATMGEIGRIADAVQRERATMTALRGPLMATIFGGN
jgi:type I restriction enzyme S subunit